MTNEENVAGPVGLGRTTTRLRVPTPEDIPEQLQIRQRSSILLSVGRTLGSDDVASYDELLLITAGEAAENST